MFEPDCFKDSDLQLVIDCIKMKEIVHSRLWNHSQLLHAILESEKLNAATVPLSEYHPLTKPTTVP